MLTENPKKLDQEIKDGLQVLWWIFNTVKSEQSKHIFDGVIRGALQLESKINQHMLSRILILSSTKILKEDTATRNHILENLAAHIALQEHISHQFELQNSL